MGMRQRAMATNASVNAVTSGTTSVAFKTVNSTSCRWPRASSGRRCAGQRALDDEEDADDGQGHGACDDDTEARHRAG